MERDLFPASSSLQQGIREGEGEEEEEEEEEERTDREAEQGVGGGNRGRRKRLSGEERGIVSLMLSHITEGPQPHPMSLWESWRSLNTPAPIPVR